MAYLRDLLIVQMGTEVSTDTYGCEVAPTVQLEGIDTFSITPVLRSEPVVARKGTLAPAHEEVRVYEEANATIGGYLSYDDAPYWLDALFGNSASSSYASYTTDANGVIQRIYKAPLVTFDTDLAEHRAFTIVQAEASLTTDMAYNIQGALAKSATFTFETGAAARFSVDFIGRESLEDSLATDVSSRTVGYVMGNHGSLYIDASDGTIGTTEIATTAFRAELNFNTNRALARHLGALTPDGHKEAKWAGNLNLTLELNSTVDAFVAALLPATTALEKQIRVKFTTGSAASLRLFQIDFAGMLLDAPVFHTDADGVLTVEMNFVGKYNSTLANWLKITSKNATASMA